MLPSGTGAPVFGSEADFARQPFLSHVDIPRFPVYLFDIDGTLLDSAPDICGAIQQVLDANGGGTKSFDYLKSYVGLHLTDLF